MRQKNETDLDRYIKFLIDAGINFQFENDDECYTVTINSENQGYFIAHQFNTIHDEDDCLPVDIRFIRVSVCKDEESK